MNSGEFIEKVISEYDFAKEQGFDSVNIVVETSGGEYEISEYENGFVNDNLDGVYAELDEITNDLFESITSSDDVIKGIRIE